MKGYKTIMKIKNLNVKRLHGQFDYEVDFFNDITFLHGFNGCGKTTILNILTSIINMDIRSLYKFNFDEIKLCYMDSDGNSGDLVFTKGNDDELILKFENNQYAFDKLDVIRPLIGDVNDSYYLKYPILSDIEALFPKVYLPLTRVTTVQGGLSKKTHNFENPFYLHGGFQPEEESDLDIALRIAERFVLEHWNDVNINLYGYEADLRNELLEIVINNNDDASAVLESLVNMKVKDLKILIEEYRHSCDIVNEVIGTTVDSFEFFDKLLETFNVFKASQKIDSFLAINFFKILQAKKVINAVTTFTNKKEKNSLHLNKFIDVIHKFFSIGNYSKHMILNSSKSKIQFFNSNPERRFELDDLSSGEKQLFLFFAHLFFNLENQDEGIFIVDEPEMSLHLEWQEIFVKTIFEINDKIQLIFATHSPEIISEYTNRTFKLEPERVID